MKALLIAGGVGTRLRPLTLTRPKHLLPVANQPHLHHVFDLLQRYDIDEVVLLTSYLAETFTASVDEARSRGLQVHVRHEVEPLGTAGALKNAEDLIDGETFFAFNGDVLTDMDLGAVLAFHRERQAQGTIVLTPVEDPSAYGVVPTQEDGRVLGFIEKPPRHEAPTNLINAGVYLLEPEVLAKIPSGKSWSTERGLFPGMVADGERLFATPTDAYWMDIGTPEKYLQANLEALEGRFKTDAVVAPGRDTNVVAEDVSIDGAQVSSSCIGSGCSIAEGARVDRSVLLPGVIIEAGASVENCVLGERAKVLSDARLTGVTAADGDVLDGRSG
ncbi:MAG: sugar phosphate nucleotidyltransferase [Actinomycetota bacterium]